MRLYSSYRQWLFPREFRIAAPTWPVGLPDLLRELAQAQDAPEPEPASPGLLEPRLLADVGTGLWRLRQRMLQPGRDRPLEEMRRAYRHLESVWDVLAEAGVEIRDHTGEAVPEGGVYALKVIAFQPTPGLSHARVLETIKPSIYYRGQAIQMGEVIVGISEGTAASASDHADAGVSAASGEENHG